MTDADAFFDDFSDGIWTKYAGNPIMKRSQLWAESYAICEPNVLYEDGVFRMWFAQMYPKGEGTTALGYATSSDGFAWTKYEKNPLFVMENGEVHRPSVMKHEGTYYLFAVQNELGVNGPATMRRWTSGDGISWSKETVVLTADQAWEKGGLANMAVIVDDDGIWQMLYHNEFGFGYAYSCDGINWTKHCDNPLKSFNFYGGDPFLVKISDRYYTWHSQAMNDSLRICCRWSTDMIHWHPVYNDPQINYTQPWEQGVPEEEGGSKIGYCGHLTDATLCEAQGKVFMIYQGAQTPLGVATFDGTFVDLANRLQHPPLSQWKESSFGMVEGGTLKIADNGSDRLPLVAEVPGVRECYALESRIQCYAGATHRVSVIMRYGDEGSFARFWLHDADHTFYQEFRKGPLFSPPVNIGPNRACDTQWHDWRVEVDGAMNRVFIDGRLIGKCRTSTALMNRLSDLPVHIGFSTLDTYTAIDHVRVRMLQ